MPLDYELVKKTFADKLSQDFAGQGRFESAFYHTVKFVYDSAQDERDALTIKLEADNKEMRDILLQLAEKLLLAREQGRFLLEAEKLIECIWLTFSEHEQNKG